MIFWRKDKDKKEARSKPKQPTQAQIDGRKKAKWKLERRKKYHTKTGADTTKRPDPGTRTRIWIPAYTRADGVRIEGHWRANYHANKIGNFAKSGVGSQEHYRLRKLGVNPRAKT